MFRVRQLAAVALYTLADVLEFVGDRVNPDDEAELDPRWLHPAEQSNETIDATLNGSGHGEDSSRRRLFRRAG